MNIAILGCGWLGLPLGKSLSEKYNVKGSVTSPEKFTLLQQNGISPFCIDLNNPVASSLTAFLEGVEVLVIAIPPKAAVKSDLSYPERLKGLIPYIAAAGIKKVLFTSSISVYGEDENLPVVDETTLPNPTTESGKQVLAAEQLLQGCPDFKTTVIRLGGLVGGERHPVYHLAGRGNVDNPNGPVNLVNREECVEIISRIIERECWDEVFVAVHPETLTRKEYYTHTAAQLNLAAPHFNEASATKGKVVKGQEKILGLLGFIFSE